MQEAQKLQNDDQWKQPYFKEGLTGENEERPQKLAWIIQEAVKAAIEIQIKQFREKWDGRETQWREELREERAMMNQESAMLKMFLDSHQECAEAVKRLRKSRIDRETRGENIGIAAKRDDQEEPDQEEPPEQAMPKVWRMYKETIHGITRFIICFP